MANLLFFNAGSRIIIYERAHKKKIIGYDTLKESRDLSLPPVFSQKNDKGEEVTYEVFQCLPSQEIQVTIK